MSIDEHKEHLLDIMDSMPDDACGDWRDSLAYAVDTMRKYQQLEDFARWVATEVIDEEMWTYNHLAFAELACRKLVRLEIMQESDGEYLYEVVEDGNGKMD